MTIVTEKGWSGEVNDRGKGPPEYRLSRCMTSRSIHAYNMYVHVYAAHCAPRMHVWQFWNREDPEGR